MIDTITRKPITLQDLQHDIAALEHQLEQMAAGRADYIWCNALERELERRRARVQECTSWDA